MSTNSDNLCSAFPVATSMQVNTGNSNDMSSNEEPSRHSGGIGRIDEREHCAHVHQSSNTTHGHIGCILCSVTETEKASTRRLAHGQTSCRTRQSNLSNSSENCSQSSPSSNALWLDAANTAVSREYEAGCPAAQESNNTGLSNCKRSLDSVEQSVSSCFSETYTTPKQPHSALAAPQTPTAWPLSSPHHPNSAVVLGLVPSHPLPSTPGVSDIIGGDSPASQRRAVQEAILDSVRDNPR